MFYFLDKIDNYIRDNGIPFRNVEINSDYLPLYFNYAILCKIRSLGPSVFDLMWPSKYVLTYDDDNNLYLEAIGSDCRTRLLMDIKMHLMLIIELKYLIINYIKRHVLLNIIKKYRMK